MPRMSKAAREIAPLVGPILALRPPANLSKAAKRRFTELVASCAADHFMLADSSLLARYAVAWVLAETAEATLERDPGDTKALALWEKSTRAMSGLALRLRLGPQSRRERAQIPPPHKNLWQKPWEDEPSEPTELWELPRKRGRHANAG